MLAVIALCIAAIGFIYLNHVNKAMYNVPEEARRQSPHRWTVDQIKAAYKKAVQSPIDVTKSLPPKQGRRYIVVGGSGSLPINLGRGQLIDLLHECGPGSVKSQPLTSI